MVDAEAQLRDRLEHVGLTHYADALIELASPSIRLRGEAEPSGEVLGRPPALVWGLERGVTAIAGGGHRLALRDDGSVAAWGYNERGQLGDGSTKFRRSPVAVCDLTEVIAVSSGQGHSLALTASGRVFAWGLNINGQLGDGTQTDRHTPVAVEGLERDVIAVAAGQSVSFAITCDGAVLGWGASPGIEFGIDHTAPGLVPGLESEIVAIALGGLHRLALTASGSILAWGSAHSHALGTVPADPSDPPSMYGPAPVEGLPAEIRAIAAGNSHSLALSAEGSLAAWGENFPFGALGDGTESRYRHRPVEVSGLTGAVRAIAAGANCSYALTHNGSLYSWGGNYEGRLGDGTTTSKLRPTPVSALAAGVVSVSEFVALMEDGSVRAWGGEYQPDERGADARLELAATKLGDLRARSRWPMRDGRPLAFVAQVDLAQVAPLDRTGLLPRAGLLSFFCGDPAGPLDPASYEVVFSESGAPLTRREFPDELPDHERYRAVALQPDAELTLPPEPPPFLSDEEREAYEWELEELVPGQRHGLLGHPDPVQADPRAGDNLELLLQVDSDDGARMMWGDVGRLYYLIGRDDLRAGRFGAVRCELQSH